MKDQCDKMKVKGRENRELIMQMLEENNAVEQHIYYSAGQAPEKIQSYSKGVSRGATDSGADGIKRKQLQPESVKAPNVLRTVYLPNEQSGSIRTEVEHLSKEIQEQKVEYEKILFDLKTQKADFEEKMRVQYLDQSEEVSKLTKELHEKETFNYQIARDHIDAMIAFEKEERELQE